MTNVSLVKSFSLFKRLLFALFILYAGWFLANYVRSFRFGVPMGRVASLFFLMVPWILFVLALLWAYFTLTGRTQIEKYRTLFRTILLFTIAVLAAGHVRLLAVERVKVSGESMIPTLANGDMIWIEKLSSGIHLPEFRFPFTLNTHSHGTLCKHVFRLPKRGDVVVFIYPAKHGESNEYLIKRVIALPKESYEIRAGSVFINGEKLDEPYLAARTKTLLDYEPEPSEAVYENSSPFVHNLTISDPLVRYSALFGIPPSGVVPDGTLLVLGDNRERSRDSRSIGFIPLFYLEGVMIRP